MAALIGTLPDAVAVWGLLAGRRSAAVAGRAARAAGGRVPGAVLLAGMPPDPAQTLGVPAPAAARLAALDPDEALVCQDGACRRIRVPTGDWVRRVAPGLFT